MTVALRVAFRLRPIFANSCAVLRRNASNASQIFAPDIQQTVDLPDIPVIDVAEVGADSTIFPFYEQWVLKVDPVNALGQSSVVDNLDLFSWYSPASWYRLCLEYLHDYSELSWVGTIVLATVCLRLACVNATLCLQRYPQKKGIHEAAIKEFTDKKKEARDVLRSETLYRKICHEENLYADTYKMRQSNRYFSLALNSVVFISQYRGISLMADHDFPGWSTGGKLWFLDLTATDPSYAIPAISAVLIASTLASGYDVTGTAASSSKWVKIIKYTAIPGVVFFFSTQVPVAVAIYWCASNAFNLLLTTMLRVPTIRYALDVPLKTATKPSTTFTKAWKKSFGWKKHSEKAAKSRSTLLEIMQRRDLEKFAKAGRTSATK